MINNYYLTNWKKIKSALREKKDFPHVVLFDFFTPEAYASIRQEIQQCTFFPEKEPMFHRYSSAVISSPLRPIFSSGEYMDFISSIVGKNGSAFGKAYSFSAGDYTLLNDSRTEGDGIDIIFDLTERWDPLRGGVITYVDGTGDALKLPVRGNTLIIVKKQEKMQRFVKYVNHLAGKHKRVFVLARISLSSSNPSKHL